MAWLSFLPVVYVPRLFRMRGNPWAASAAMLANLHLICEPAHSWCSGHAWKCFNAHLQLVCIVLCFVLYMLLS